MYLRVSITERCNLRCRYCLPEDARFSPARCDAAELRHLTGLVVRAAGVSKIRITGGEPTLSPDLEEHVRHAAGLVDEVGLTTNGVLLEERLPALRAAGLNRLNVSLDAVDADGFRRVARRDGLDRALSALRRARAIGFAPLRVNAVALGETDYAAMVEAAVFEGWHLRFIELMAIGVAGAWQQAAVVEAAEIRERLWEAGISLVEDTALDQPTARVYRVPGVAAEHATVGFITTGSAPFCASCDRLRLTSQGRLHTCLFDETGVDLIGPLRAGGEAAVERAVVSAVAAKRPPEHFLRHGAMAAIGG